MSLKDIIICGVIMPWSMILLGQISPGKLADVHAHLEGLSNCTQCHDLGNKVPDKKCLNCHQEIDQLLTSSRGFHFSTEVKEQNCIDCHSDHHGKRFEMIRFDEDAFDHNLTGYELQGNHAVIDCRECHQPENIKDSEIRQRKGTFLGLEKQCLDCHDDYHQSTLGAKCLECHNFEDFSPAVNFSHDDSKFVLKGEHRTVDCIKCHPISMKNGSEFQQFNELAYSSCVDCHNDPHQGQISTNCAQCHTESSFSDFIGTNFNHNRTNFELRAAHRSVSCFECHEKTSNPTTIFQDKLNISESACIECHDDVHSGKFGNDCAKCHSEESFHVLKDMDFFNHDLTDFPLEGLHIGQDCKECHQNSLTESIDFSECRNCHEDYHNEEFMVDGKSPDCIDCHTLEQQFTYTTYGYEDHSISEFPLEGSHLATPCFMCHVDENRWNFNNIGESCVDCHDDIHEGFLDSSFYPNQDCSGCHSSESWDIVTFDHDQTGWILTEAHINVSCRSCHFDVDKESVTLSQVFADIKSECVQCHKNIHGDQFEINEVTNCTRCHEGGNWDPVNFNHNSTSFLLDGKHLEVSCKGCHSNYVLEDEERIVIYKIANHECVDCHSY